MTVERKLRKLTEALSLDELDFKHFDKKTLTRDNYYMLLNKTAQMFEYDGLPPTLPKIALETLLQTEGSCAIWKPPDQNKPIGFGPYFQYDSLETGERGIYAFTYSLADAPDPYHVPYKVTIANPGFYPTISVTLEINKDCVIIKNDTYARGLRWLHKKYAYLLTEAEISLRSTLICLRDQMTFIAKTEPQRVAVAKYIDDRENGVPGSILAPDLGSPLEAVKNDGRTNSVELAVNGRQAIYAAWYNEIGLNPSFSLKREYTSAQEIDTNTDLLVPTVDDMLRCRELACESINSMFGTNITVRKSSAWEIKQTQIENALAMEEAQAEALKFSGEGGEENDSIREDNDETSGGGVS